MFKVRYSHANYMIASTEITNTEVFAFIAVLVFKLLNFEVLFETRKQSFIDTFTNCTTVHLTMKISKRRRIYDPFKYLR